MEEIKSEYDNLVADRLENLANLLSGGKTISRDTLDNIQYVEALAALRYATASLRH